MRFWPKKEIPAPALKVEPRIPLRVRQGSAASITPERPPINAFVVPAPAPGVLPAGVATMATDENIKPTFVYASGGLQHEGLQFMGYPYLAELSQRPEYRHIVETLAKEMTRKWVTLHAPGDLDKSDRCAQIDEAMKRFRVRDRFRRAAEVDGFFGRSHLFLDFGNADPAELKTPLTITSAKIGKNSLKRLKVIEPMWTYPAQYNASNPLEKNWYDPETWYVMGTEVHKTRLLTFVGREVPDILKPAYMFGGLSLTQMVKAYVDHFLRMRDSVSDIANAFSVMVLMTDLSSALAGGGWDNVTERAAVLNRYRTNRGLFLANKETEDFKNVAAPIAGLSDLLAQAQEQMASVSGEPLVKLFGITPKGLNASSQGELEAWDDTVAAYQQRLFADNLKHTLDVIQMSEFGDIDRDIDARFEPLKQMTEAELATIRKTNADSAAVYIADGVMSPAEERSRLAKEEGGIYADLDLNVEIDPPDEGLDPNLGGGVGKEVPPRDLGSGGGA